jgi:O-antigen ligase
LALASSPESRNARPEALLSGLMASLPFLLPVHRLPLPSFDSEWLAFLLGMGALAWRSLAGRACALPAMAAAPLALVLVLAAQAALGLLPYPAHAVMTAGILVWAALLMALARGAAADTGFWRTLGLTLLWGALANALAGMAQWAAPAEWLTSAIVPAAPGEGVYGNIAQQNHFAAHMALGLASALAFLAPGRARLLCMLVLATAMLLSGSRTALLFGALLVLATWHAHWRRVLAACGATAAVLVAAHAGLLGAQLGRLAALDQGAWPRLFFWRHAAAMFAAHPLAGVGFDGYAYALVQGLQPGEQVYGIDQYAHDLPLQLLATAGAAGFLAVAVPAALFLRRVAAAATRTRAQRWAALALGIVAIHSLFEQPLYYTYFLGVAALACGLLDPSSLRLPRMATGAPALVLLAAALAAGRDYADIVPILYGSERDDYARVALARRLHARSLFPGIADLAVPQAAVPTDAPAQQRLALNDRIARYAPVPEVLFRQAALLAESGQPDAAVAQLRQAALAYPRELPRYAGRYAALAARDPAHFAVLDRTARALLRADVSASH